jgi:hypothetical protein
VINLIQNPFSEIERAKSDKTVNRPITLLFIASVLFAVGGAIGASVFFNNLASMTQASLNPEVASVLAMGGVLGVVATAIVVFLVILVGVLIDAYFLNLICKTLGFQGVYADALNSISIPVFLFSVGFVIAMILNLIPFIGLVLMLLVMLYFASISVASFYRAIKELYNTDWLGVLIVFSVVSMVFVVMYFVGLLGVATQVMGLGGTIGKMAFTPTMMP